MYCANCGSNIALGTRFCPGCGVAVVDPEMTRLAGAQPGGLLRNEESSEVERTIFTARPTMLFIKIGYVAAALGAVLLTVMLALLSFVNIPWYVSLPLALALLLIPAYYHLKRNMVSYTLTDSKVMIDQGLIARTTRSIPLRNIQDVTVSATIPQRLLGFGNLIIDNASEQSGTTILRNINDPRHHADLLLRELRRWR
jgi:uncharacterized membrane protein YdbT with pleckstrin-like domain